MIYNVCPRNTVFALYLTGAIMNIDIPKELVGELDIRRDRLREVLLLYKQGVVSFGRAAELAKLSRQDMIQQARVAGVEPRWSEDMLRAELA
jgi:predicted HTH domain antitoxin